jgi:signal transduction histidine kinase
MESAMRLEEFMTTYKDELVERWEVNAAERLGLDLEESQLRNNLPEFIDDVIDALAAAVDDGRCRDAESARTHGRQRMRLGVDIGRLTEEMMLVGETVAELARERGYEFSGDELLRMMGIIGQGAAASVGAYGELRDKQLADQAAQHFSFIAHEIRNPLHNANLAAQALTIAPEEGRGHYLAQLARSLAQLAELVDDSLIEARLYGEPNLRISTLRSADIIDEVRGDLEDQARERKLEVTTTSEDFSFEADHTIVSSALTNLVKNAVKFTREGSRIVVSARAVDDRAVFEVEDQCGGIPEHLLPRMFQKFVQGKHEKGGSGLGLIIVKQAAEAHGGAVSVSNRPGTGCTFVVELPLAQPKKD